MKRFLLVAVAAAALGQEPGRVVPREILVQPGQPVKELTADDVAKYERQVAANPEDLVARRALLQYYYAATARTARLPHVYWIIEHHPDDEIITRGFCDLPPDTALASRADYEYGRSLWLTQISRNAQNVHVRENAARYFEPYDLQLAVENLQAAVEASGAENTATRLRLARLYSRIVNASAFPPPDAAERFYTADAGLTSRIKSDLDSSNDWRLLMMVAGSLRDRAMNDRLMTRVNNLHPDAYKVQPNGVIAGIIGSVPSAAPAPPTPGAIRVGGNVQAMKLVRKVTPEYPALAKQARVQGTVRFNVTIARDGTIENLMLVSGHPLLVSPAQEAVRQWVYQPTLLNGSPVEVITTVDVNFTLADVQPQAEPPASK